MSNLDTARAIIAEIEAAGAEIYVAADGLKLRPISRIDAGLLTRARRSAADIRALLDNSEVTELAALGRPCWRCAANPEPPSMDEQLEMLIYEHKKRPEIFHLRESEIARLKALLQPDDMLAIVAGAVVRGTDPMYAGIAVLRDGKIVVIDRRELADG